MDRPLCHRGHRRRRQQQLPAASSVSCRPQRIGGRCRDCSTACDPSVGRHPTTRTNFWSGCHARRWCSRSSTAPRSYRDDWAVAKTRLTGICGSDAKMVFMDFGDDYADSALNGYFTFPTVFGHEVVADVVEVGPAVTTLEVGQRVVLNPWLSCGPRGIDPPCGSCQAGRLQHVLALHREARSPRASIRAPRRTRRAASPSTSPRTSPC